MTAETIHTCSYECERPECIRAQRDELVARLTAETSNSRGEVVAWFPTNAQGEIIRNYGDGSPVYACKTKEEAEQAKRCHLGATGPVIPLYAAPPPPAAEPVAYIHPDSISALTLAPGGAWLRVFTRGKQPPPDGWTPVYTTAPSAPKAQGGGEVIQRHVVTKYRDGSVHVADVTAPTSAPVGVDAPGSRAWMAEVCRAAALSLAAHGVRNDQLPKVADWIAQQPAAVDEAMTRRIMSEFHANDPGDVWPPDEQGRLRRKALQDAINNALATQHQEPKP